MSDKDNVLISVIVPTFNHAKYLHRAIKSVLAQTHQNFELIIIDNYSTDDTNSVIGGFNDQRIICIKTNNNGVIAKSRNLGIKKAKGEWIAFLDSDDWWQEDKLKKCIFHAKDSVDLIFHDLKIHPHSYKSFLRRKIKGKKLCKPVLNNLLTSGNVIPNSSVVVRRKILMQINGVNESPDLVAAEDYHTWLKIAQCTDGFLYLPYTLGNYTIHGGGTSNRDMTEPSFLAVKDFLQFLDFGQRKNVDAYLAYGTGRYKFIKGEFKDAPKHLKIVIRSGPIFEKLKSFIMLLIIICQLNNFLKKFK